MILRLISTLHSGDLDAFLALDKQSVIDKFENHFSSTREQAEIVRSENLRLTEQLTSLRQKLNTVKLALVDKDVQLFELSRSQNPSTKIEAQSNIPITAGTKAMPASTGPTLPKQTNNPRPFKPKQIDSRPTLIAWLHKDVPSANVSVNKIDSLMNLDLGGPVVQQFKKTEDKVTLTFKDVAARDKAKDLISKNSQQVLFQSVSVPQKSYPAIARLNGLSDVQSLTNDDSQVEKQLRSASIMKSLLEENPTLQGTLLSVRILSNRSSTSSFHVRLGLSSKNTCDQLIEKGRVLVDKRSHAVVMADFSKEIRHCTRCQKYGHLARFCKSAADTCGKCAGQHASSSCDALPKGFKCANCSKNHTASSRSCPIFFIAVSQYQTYISTRPL